MDLVNVFYSNLLDVFFYSIWFVSFSHFSSLLFCLTFYFYSGCCSSCCSSFLSILKLYSSEREKTHTNLFLVWIFFPFVLQWFCARKQLNQRNLICRFICTWWILTVVAAVSKRKTLNWKSISGSRVFFHTQSEHNNKSQSFNFMETYFWYWLSALCARSCTHKQQ